MVRAGGTGLALTRPVLPRHRIEIAPILVRKLMRRHFLKGAAVPPLTTLTDWTRTEMEWRAKILPMVDQPLHPHPVLTARVAPVVRPAGGRAGAVDGPIPARGGLGGAILRARQTGRLDPTTLAAVRPELITECQEVTGMSVGGRDLTAAPTLAPCRWLATKRRPGALVSRPIARLSPSVEASWRLVGAGPAQVKVRPPLVTLAPVVRAGRVRLMSV